MPAARKPSAKNKPPQQKQQPQIPNDAVGRLHYFLRTRCGSIQWPAQLLLLLSNKNKNNNNMTEQADHAEMIFQHIADIGRRNVAEFLLRRRGGQQQVPPVVDEQLDELADDLIEKSSNRTDKSNYSKSNNNDDDDAKQHEEQEEQAGFVHDIIDVLENNLHGPAMRRARAAILGTADATAATSGDCLRPMLLTPQCDPILVAQLLIEGLSIFLQDELSNELVEQIAVTACGLPREVLAQPLLVKVKEGNSSGRRGRMLNLSKVAVVDSSSSSDDDDDKKQSINSKNKKNKQDNESSSSSSESDSSDDDDDSDAEDWQDEDETSSDDDEDDSDGEDDDDDDDAVLDAAARRRRNEALRYREQQERQRAMQQEEESAIGKSNSSNSSKKKMARVVQLNRALKEHVVDMIVGVVFPLKTFGFDPLKMLALKSRDKKADDAAAAR